MGVATETYYDTLGIDPYDPDIERAIRSAYRKLAHRYHPDKKKTANAKLFMEVQTAYEALIDPVSRANYNRLHGIDLTRPPYRAKKPEESFWAKHEAGSSLANLSSAPPPAPTQPGITIKIPFWTTLLWSLRGKERIVTAWVVAALLIGGLLLTNQSRAQSQVASAAPDRISPQQLITTPEARALVVQINDVFARAISTRDNSVFDCCAESGYLDYLRSSLERMYSGNFALQAPRFEFVNFDSYQSDGSMIIKVRETWYYKPHSGAVVPGSGADAKGAIVDRSYILERACTTYPITKPCGTLLIRSYIIDSLPVYF